MLKWPSAEEVESGLRRWLGDVLPEHPEVVRCGYFGSYARGEPGVGSDLDLVAVVDRSDRPFHQRSLPWPTEVLPVPAELLVYTEEEWNRLQRRGGRFAEVLEGETVWVYRRGDAHPPEPR